MNFHYPNGKVYHKTEWKSAKKSSLTFANRGCVLKRLLMKVMNIT